MPLTKSIVQINDFQILSSCLFKFSDRFMKPQKNLRVIFLLAFFCFLSECLTAQQTDTAAKKTDSLLDVRAVLISNNMKEKWIRSEYAKGNNEWKKVKEFSVFTLDFNTMAMHVDQAGLEKKLDVIPKSANWFNEYETIAIIGNSTLLWEITFEERPMYFDYEGYVYTKGKKSRWMKTPLTTLYKFMSVPFAFPNIFPQLKLPDGNYTYYGIDVSPGRYPILEWAFRYKMQYFEGSDNFKHEFVEYGGEGGHSKYTLQTGKDKGSFVIFDGLGRLREINSIHSGMIQYTYGDYTVQLPDSNKTDYFSDQIQWMNMKKQ